MTSNDPIAAILDRLAAHGEQITQHGRMLQEHAAALTELTGTFPGGTGHDEAGARGPNDKDPIDRPRIKSGAPFLLGGVGRELQRARRGRRE